MPTNMSMSRTRRGDFSAVGKAASESAAAKPTTYEEMKARQHALGPTGPDGPITQPTNAGPVDEEVLNQPALEPDEEAPVEKHPVYDSQDGEHPDTGHAHLMQDLGLAIKQMMEKDPDTNKSMADLMEEFMGKGVDFEAEGRRLKGLIEQRKVPKAPNWVAAGVGSWAGGPEVRSKFHALQEAARTGEAKKQSDLEGVESKLLQEHVDDLRARGKTKEALMLGLLQGTMAQKRTETTEAGKSERAADAASLRRELQERALGAAEERVRLNISSRKDVANQDRTAAQVMHLYESLLRQTEKDITGAVKPIYSAEEAMDMALNTILPKVKSGVEAVKTGEAPPPAEGATPAPAQRSGGSKFAQWKAQQAAGKTPVRK